VGNAWIVKHRHTSLKLFAGNIDEGDNSGTKPDGSSRFVMIHIHEVPGSNLSLYTI
jgi:hypothetical protein